MIQNKPLRKPFSINDIPTLIRAEMQQIISNKCHVDLAKPRLVLNDKKSENVIVTYKQVYDKVASLNFSPVKCCAVRSRPFPASANPIKLNPVVPARKFPAPPRHLTP